MSRMANVLICGAAFVFSSLPWSSSQAQAIARPRHPEPLARPVPLTTLRACDPLPLLRAVQAALQADSFTITHYDEPHYVIEAEKTARSEEHTSELQSRLHLVCRLLLEKKKNRRPSRLLRNV